MKTKEILNLIGELIETETQIKWVERLDSNSADQFHVKFARIRYLIDLQIGEISNEIEKKVQVKSKKTKYNVSFDPRIQSKSIENSLNSQSYFIAYTVKDLEVWIIIHLLRTFDNINEKGTKMISFLESFVEFYKESFSFEDIMRNQAGSARVVANLRFAINHLRVLGIVLSKDDKALKLTFFGFLLGLSFFFKINESEIKEPYGKKIDRESSEKAFLGILDYRLLKQIEKFRDKNFFLEFIRYYELLDFKEEIGSLFKSYSETIYKYINVKENKEAQKQLTDDLEKLGKENNEIFKKLQNKNLNLLKFFIK